MQRLTTRILVASAAAAFGLAALLETGCSDRERVDVGVPAAGFRLGPPTSYPVSGTGEITVQDSVSKAVFFFPSGGAGTLSVARILAAPIAEPDSADGFLVEFTSDERIHLRLPREGGREPLLWAYARPTTSTYAPLPQPETWIPLMPADTLSNPAVFELYEPGVMPEGGGSPKRGRGFALGAEGAKARPAQSYFFMRRYITRDGSDWKNLENIRQVTQWTIADVIDSLPGTLGAFAENETQNRLALRGWRAVAAPEVSSYNAFEYWAYGLYRRVYPRFNFVAVGSGRATEFTIAHEVGHYFSHVFLGDDGFEALSSQLRTDHEFGDPHSERPMLEEYAMLIDFFKNGSIDGRLNPEQPVTELLRNHGNDKPSNVDWPSKEGYPTCLLARLRATGGTIAGFSSVAEEIPVIGMSFAEIFAMLYTRQPLTAGELRVAIAERLQQRGVADRLPPLLERTGWSYHGHGAVKDGQGRAVAGAWVQSLCRVASEGGRVYYAPLVPVQTKADGSFELSRLFPGESTLRVQVEDRVYEFPITVDPVPSTVVSVPLGDLTVTASLLDELKRLTWVYLRCNGEFDLDNGGMEVTMFGAGEYWRLHPATWEGNKLTWDFADSSSFGGSVNGIDMHCEATFAADGHSIQSLMAHSYGWESFQGALTHTQISDIDIRDLAEDWIDLGTPGSKFAYFNRQGSDIGPRINSISFVERYHTSQQVVTITATRFRWTGTQMPGWVELSLKDNNQ